MSVRWGFLLADEFSTTDSSLLLCTAAVGVWPACTRTPDPAKEAKGKVCVSMIHHTGSVEGMRENKTDEHIKIPKMAPTPSPSLKMYDI